MKTHVLVTTPHKDYALIDSGDGMKLERYGDVRVARPDPQALWRKSLPEKEWMKADAYFRKETSKDSTSLKGAKKREGGDGDAARGEESERGKWVIARPNLPETWPIVFGDMTFTIKLTPFKHTGIFPEQHNNWLWCREIIKDAIKNTSTNGGGNKKSEDDTNKKPTVLNLFGYTGGASLSAALGGAEVTHVDASRGAVTWANENAAASSLKDAPIRWILDDAAAFVKREIRRGKKYDAIIMDPPAFGRGAKGEIWKIEDCFLPLFEDCVKLLSDTPLFVVLNGYAAGYSSIAYENNMKILVDTYGGSVESGELTLEEEGPQKRLLPCGIVSRWKRG